MKRVMYLDCFSGAAGDMLLGAFLDAGLPEAVLREALGSLGVGHELHVRRVNRCGVTATKFDVTEKGGSPESVAVATPAHTHAHTHTHTHVHDHGHGHTHSHEHTHEHVHGHTHDHAHADEGSHSAAGGHAHTHGPADHHAHTHGEHEHAHDEGGHAHGHGHSHPHAHPHSHGSDGHRSLSQIAHLIGHSSLSAAAKARAISLFRRLAEAEAAIHGMPVEEVHLHEVGALDSIIDIVGNVFAMEWFGVDEVVASPLNVGSGTVRIAHGVFPVPAPATLSLLVGAPVYSAGPATELVTPTGALIVTGYAQRYGTMPAMTVERTGYGAGTKDFFETPNVVRVVIGTAGAPEDRTGGEDGDSIVRLECEIDDMNPQIFGPATERLFAAGAVDVFLTAVQMKKGRPGTLITVLAPEEQRTAISTILFRETSTLGVRYERMSREVLSRRWVQVQTSGGAVRIKIGERGGEVLNAAPEFDDCVRIAAATGLPVKAVYAEAQQAWMESRSKE